MSGTLSTPQGTEVTVPPGEPATQIQVPEGGTSIINVGVVPVMLSPVDPAQAGSYMLQPGGAIPWNQTSCYATVSGVVAGEVYSNPNVQAYGGNLGTALTQAGLAGQDVVSQISNPIVAGDMQAILEPTDIPNGCTLWCLGYYLDVVEIGSPPSKGMVLFNIALSSIEVVDTVTPQNTSSNRLAGLSIPPGGSVSATNITDQTIEAAYVDISGV